jgi:hypothetical protein
MGFKIYLAFCWLKNAFSGKNTNLRGFILRGMNLVFPEFLLIEAICVRIFGFFRIFTPLLCKPVNSINSIL